MVTELGRMVTWMAPYHKVTHHSVHVVLQSHVTNKNHISSTRVPMATKLGKMGTYFERLLTIKSFYALITWSCKVTWQKNPLYLYYISIMANKHGTMMTSIDGLQPIMSHDPLITWPCEIWGSLTEGVSACKRLSRHRLLVLIYFTMFKDQLILISKYLYRPCANQIY